MRKAMLALAAIGIVLTSLSAYAIPPAVCRLRGEAVFIAPDAGRGAHVILNLRLKSYEGDIEIDGRVKCTGRDQSGCFIPKARVSGFTQSVGDRLSVPAEFQVYDANNVTICEFRGETPLMRVMCPGSIGGTFVCAAHDGFEELSGTFGFTVDSCESCLHPKTRTP